MEIFLALLGILTVTFFLLASVNGLKRYVKAPIIKKVAQQHRLFGMLATITALVHMVVAVFLGELRITGTLALLALIVTGMMGMMFSNQKSKIYYLLHRIMGPVTLVLIIIHIIFNATT
jgi:hypothetical protein